MLLYKYINPFNPNQCYGSLRMHRILDTSGVLLLSVRENRKRLRVPTWI